MALFSSYAPPGIYTIEIFSPQAAAAIGTARIPVIIGEGQQFFTFPNIELFRGSSAVQDDQAVNENISNQITGFTRSFQTTYFPIVDGTGKGVTTNDPSKIQVTAIDTNGNVLPVTVVSLTGATGRFQTQDIIPLGFTLKATFFFKRGDTLVTNEDASFQIPQYASLIVTPSVGNSVTLTLQTPGQAGNLVTLQFTAGPAVPDAQAVSGAGTDAITVNITGPSSTRTLQTLINLVNAGIPTLDGGFLVVSSSAGSLTTPLVAGGASPFSGGFGGNSNTVFQVKNFPIVDGTNGGVTTTNPAKVTSLVNGLPAIVSAVNGLQGLVTLANPVPFGATLTFTYFYNTWQNTFDLLPASNIASITSVGLGPNRNDFVQNVDFALGVDSSGNGTINWGNSVSEAIGVSTAGELANFTPSEIVTSLVDDFVFLRPVSGVINNRNTVFTLADQPTDGSGLGVITQDPTKVSVYVGSDPLEAYLAGPVKVARLARTSITLYNPPTPSGSSTTQPLESVGVWASYYRNTLATHQYSVQVVSPGYAGLGTFLIQDELSRVAPLVTFTSSTVADAGFAASGVIYPFGKFDAQAQAGAAIDENITLTFRNDGNTVITPATPSSLALTNAFGSTGGSITFTAGIPGINGRNVSIALDATSLNPSPLVVNGDSITIYANWTGTLLTLTQIAALFPSAETISGGQIIASGAVNGTAVQTTAAQSLTGGANAVTAPVSHSYTVAGGVNGSTGIGYLNQTYVDAKTGFRVTVLDAASGVDLTLYGNPAIPTRYAYAPGDVLRYNVKADATGANAAVRHAGTPGTAPAEANTLVAIPGLRTTVISNFQSTTGDTVVVSTFRGSGSGPSVGTFYRVSFTTNKVAADYALKLFTNPSDAYAQYGQPSTVNRLSLGIQLMAQNGVQTFGAIQVPVQPGTNLGASSDFIAALQQLTKNLPGFNRKADVIVPLSNDPSVHQALGRQLITQAGSRFKGEAIGFVGYSQFTTSDVARANARALHNSRMIAVGNAAAGILITDPTTGVAVEFPVDGPFMAAAMAGLNSNPANDVATTLTLQNLTGFSRLLVTYDDPTMDFMAADGLTMLLNNNGALQIRHYKTTDPSNDLTSEPTSITITDYVAQQFRRDLQQFIGRKLVDALVTDIQVVANSRLKSLQDQVLISGYRNLTVVVNPQDPTEVDVTVTFKPIFSLLFASVTFVVQTSL